MNNCKICNKPTKNKTCSKECLAKLRSINSSIMVKNNKYLNERGKSY